jgi:RNA polymerase sigma-70 factor (ECF subfamily)
LHRYDPTFLASGRARTFKTTHWSVVLKAGNALSDENHEALEKLCRAYWFPLYGFVRRKGFSRDEAKDLTQGFFERVLEKNPLSQADAYSPDGVICTPSPENTGLSASKTD